MTPPRSAVRSTLRFLLPLGGAALTGGLAVAAYTAHVLNAPRKRTWQDEFSFTPWEVQVPHELVEFQADDGVLLRGWWMVRPETTRVVVGCTGHRREKYELLGIGSALWRAGNNVLLFDFRGLGDSEQAPLSLGHNELLDAQGAVRFVRRRVQGARIGVIGYSMGAAVAILLTARDPDVRAVVADSSFASIDDVVAFAFKRRRLPVRPLLALTSLINGWRHGYRFSAVRPVDAIGSIQPRPVLIIHGGADAVTSVEDAFRLYNAAAQPKDLWIVEAARHCGAYFADRALYAARVSEFFDTALREREGVDHAEV